MKDIEIKLHSMVDIITNSSTVIYVQAFDSTIEAMKALINKFLSDGGSTKTADDLYYFYLKPEFEREYDRISDVLCYDRNDEDEDVKKYVARFKLIDSDFTREKFKLLEYKEESALINTLLDKIGIKEIEPYMDEDYENINYHLVLKPKGVCKADTINITEKIVDMFDIDEYPD